MAKTAHRYAELEIIEVPEAVPELGIEAGEEGTVVDVYAGGRLVVVEMNLEDGTSSGLVDIDLEPEPRVVGHTSFSR